MTRDNSLYVGAASASIAPPLGLPMMGYARRHQPAAGYGLPLEVSATAFESGDVRVIIVGVDTIGMRSPHVDRLRARVAEVTGATPAGVLLNWSHTHCGPIGPEWTNSGAPGGGDIAAVTAPYRAALEEQVVDVARRAVDALEPAAVVWGVGKADEAVNRRERDDSGRVILGWNPDELVDTQIVALQARRPDESVISTIVGYGCHPITLGAEVLDYSADFVGPLRDAVRNWTDGECVFLQGACGNTMPRVAMCDSDRESRRLGERLALEALRAVAAPVAGPFEITRRQSGSLTPFSLYRFERRDAPPPVLACAEREVSFPLRPLPSLEEVRKMRLQFEADVEAAEREGADQGRLYPLRFHVNWAAATEAEIEAGTARESVSGPINAVRIGDGAIVSGPGEVFTEIALTVRERSPADVTLYAGYTNGLVGYLPTDAAFEEGGYEPDYSYRSFGIAAPIAPGCERILAENGLRLLEGLFPERDAPSVQELGPRGHLPDAPETSYERPR